MKVVRLLQDMQHQLESELADDKAVHEQLDCWCKTNDREKTQAIEMGEERESQLKAFLGEAAAKMEELTAKRNAALKEVDRDFDALQEAQALRRKENVESHTEEADLIEAIKACDQAITVLKEYNPNAADLAQVRAVAHRLQAAQVLELGKRSATASQLAALRAFLSQGQGATSFLAIPGYQSFGSQTGAIFGVLEQMKEDFEKDLSDNQAKEKAAAEAFAQLKAAKEEEIAAGRALVLELDGEIADLKAKHAEAFKELEDVQAQLELDRTFLANLKEKCAETDAEFEKRVADRNTEIAAVADTIKILNTDEAFDNFATTVNNARGREEAAQGSIQRSEGAANAGFLQTGSRSSHQESAEQQMKLRKVAQMLESAAGRLGVPALSQLAVRAQLDAFTRVKADIDKMVAELSQQQKDEEEHRDWCIDEFNKNNRSTAAADDKKNNLIAKIAELEKEIESLTKEIDASVAAVAEMQEQMKRASENREAENADYQQTLSDQRMTQMILNKALDRMKQVYAFLQSQQPGAPHIQTSGTHTDPGNGPARFTKYETNVGGGRVVSMLEEIIGDSRTMENDAIQAEQDAQVAYESMMQDSNKAITQYTKKIVNMKGARANAQESKTLAKSDLKATLHELEDLHNTFADLQGSCNFILKNFDARQEARQAEINALREAKAILSGMQ